ncbi:hypothetical protein [Streptomyces sp. NPDC002566]|uniref:hypothetical protein n=1 Tax=Streptomyces sp. NPDC002566 TaxID=3364650 RepID=UPI0036BC02BA
MRGGSTAARDSRTSQDAINPHNLVNALGSLRNAPRCIETPAGRETLGRNIVRIIQATAETARFATLQALLGYLGYMELYSGSRPRP